MNEHSQSKPFHRQLRVCLVSSQASFHGGERQMLLLAEGLNRRNHAVLSMVRAHTDVAQRMRESTADVFEFGGRGRSPKSLLAIRKELKRFDPDVLLYNDSHALIFAGVASWKLPIAARVLCRRVAFPLRSPVHVRWWADKVICVSTSVEAICRQAGLDQRMLTVVHDGVEPETLTKTYASAAQIREQFDRRPLILTVAKLAECKGHRYLLEAMPSILEYFPNALWLVAGEGKQRSELERRIGELHLENHVRLLGHREDTSDLMRAANVLVMPSHTEGLCSSIIDAMLLRCPVIASRAGGIPDLLQDGSKACGRLVEPRNPNDLAKHVIELFQNSAGANELAISARESALRRFTSDVMVERTLDVFHRMLAEDKSNRVPQQRAA